MRLGGTGGRRSGAWASLVVLVGYAAVSCAYFGIRLGSHPGRYLVGDNRDPQIFVWSFAWWRHALAAWENPFVTRVIYAPHGIDLAWATTVPLLTLPAAPVTALFGPDVAYNLAMLLAPALSAFTAYLLCRYLTRSLWASLVGGYIFGFSSYALGQEAGAHLNMAAAFLVPLIALATVRYLRADLDGRGFAWRLGALFGLQLWLSTELAATAAIALAASLVLAFFLVPSTRVRLRPLARPLFGAVAVAAALAAPLVYYLVTDFRSGSFNPPSSYDGDLVNFFVPTQLIWAGGSRLLSHSQRFAANLAEQGSYLGLPTLVIVVWYGIAGRRSASARFLLAALLLAAAVTLGTALDLEGHAAFRLPWDALAGLPVLDNILPARLSVYLSLAAAVIVALWTAGRSGGAAKLLPALAVLALVPDLSHAYWTVHPERLAFFTAGTYRICIHRDENVAIFPFGYWGYSTLWQAETNFFFRMPEGYLTPEPPATSTRNPAVSFVVNTNLNPSAGQLVQIVRGEHVDRVVSVDHYSRPGVSELQSLGEVQVSGGADIAPACGYRSLRKAR